MALINPEFYTGPALIVGDGNFSFSACLASCCGEISTPIFATSLDTEEQLHANPFAMENLAKLSGFPQFNVIHGVDATNLEGTFKSQQFHKIVFNFPHTGGKLKISKCRDLLEKFCISASRQIEPTRGVVCVSLCQGQGGIPKDPTQRDYGNTWQVVEQAAKAGLILSAVRPFKESDYPGYSSSGFKGRIHQRFTTKNGLTYLFIPGTPLSPIPDINSVLEMKKLGPKKCEKLYLTDNHPLGFVKKKIESFYKTLSPEKNNGKEEFVICTDSEGTEEGAVGISKKLECSLSLSSKGEESDPKSGSSLYQEVCQRLKEGHQAFVVSGIESDYTVPPSAGFYPITHHTVISRSYNTDVSLENIESDLKSTCQMLCNAICPGIAITDEMSKETINQKETLNFPKRQLNLFKPVDYQRLRERQRIKDDWRPTSNLSSETQHSNYCYCLQENFTQNSCRICKLEEGYCSKKDSVKITDLLDRSRILRFYCDRVLFTCSLVNKELLSWDHKGWIIVAHLDNLTMTLCDISDIRMLWSSENLFLQQFAAIEDELNFPHFQPFSLFQPIYIHDISFWLNQDSTQETFFRVLHEVTKNCVSDVYFRERYVDNDKVSYNYRMVYSRCDGPMTHMQTVEVQNLLRQVLLDLKFNLS